MIHDSFIRIILHALNQSFGHLQSHQEVLTKCPSCQVHHDQSDMKCSCERHALYSGSVLAKVLAGQRLGCISWQEALEMARYLNSHNANFVQDLRRQNFSSMTSSSLRLPQESLYDFYLRMIWFFFVSLTFNDCSIMVTIQRMADECTDVNDSHCIYEERSGCAFAASVAIVDLDPKLPQSYAHLERKLMEIGRLETSVTLISDQNANNEFYCPQHQYSGECDGCCDDKWSWPIKDEIRKMSSLLQRLPHSHMSIEVNNVLTCMTREKLSLS